MGLHTQAQLQAPGTAAAQSASTWLRAHPPGSPEAAAAVAGCLQRQRGAVQRAAASVAAGRAAAPAAFAELKGAVCGLSVAAHLLASTGHGSLLAFGPAGSQQQQVGSPSTYC